MAFRSLIDVTVCADKAPPKVEIPENIALPSTLILAATPGLAPISIPCLAVINPTESIFVTSSYVKTPPI